MSVSVKLIVEGVEIELKKASYDNSVFDAPNGYEVGRYWYKNTAVSIVQSNILNNS